jgi:hypothetical protein
VLKDNVTTYTCEHPESAKKIKLVDGPIFKISYSEEIDTFKNKTYDFYIIVPFVFIVDFLLSMSLKEVEFKSVDDFINEINKIDLEYERTNNIPDKCLKTPLQTRRESKDPYNTTCIFIPGFVSLGNLLATLEKTIVKEIPLPILSEYYNIIDEKINKPDPVLTVFEYVMYVASMNRVKNTKYNYVSLCNSANDITC